MKRHATSKISERDDLNSIMTLGFRGEALAAISSVSEVTIITKTKEADTGYMLTSEGGRIIDMSEVGASDGTTVVVENLFFNVPARRKFLKKDATEAMNVAALVEKIALSRPDISIQLLIDGEEKFKTPGDSELLHTIRAIYGKEFASKLIKAEGISDGIKVSGYIGRSDNVRKNRNLENVFINGRYVKSLTAQAAIEKAYTSFIATEHFPTCALNIEMHPGIVDVNVHPAKLEVKFSDERKVFEAVYYTVKKALEESEYRPEMELARASKSDYNPVSAFVPIGEKTSGEQISMQGVAPRVSSGSNGLEYTSTKPEKTFSTGIPREKSYDLDKPVSVSSVGYEHTERKTRFDGSSYESLSPKESVDLLAKYRTATPKTEISETVNAASNEKNIEEEIQYKYVGEAFDCYVIIEYEGSLLIIDKHAAHERIIFEDLKRGRNDDKMVASQNLMLPVTIILTPDELSHIHEFEKDFKKVGFDFNINDKSVDITSIPTSVSPTDSEGLFVEMLGDLIDGIGTPENAENIRLEKALYSVACKAAIKGGRVYDKAIIDWLIKKVLALPDITVCPHGRPIAYKLKKAELDRQFERIK